MTLVTVATAQPASGGRAGSSPAGRPTNLTVGAHPAGDSLSSSGTNVWELGYCGIS